jgi:ABC-type Mn2+/Zn2+ transport system permease subunit
MRQALVSGVLVALMCSFLGLFVVLRRIVFVSVALAQLSSAGVAFGIFSASFPFLASMGLQHGIPPTWGAALFTLAGVVFFSLRLSPRRIPNDSTIGMAYCLAGALAILLLARSAEGEGDMLQLLQGNILTGTAQETWLIAVVFAVIALVLFVARKEFMLVSFDRDLATTSGFSAAWWDFLLYAILGIVIALSVRAVGVLLTTALLIIPATSALLFSQNWTRIRVLAPLLAVWAVPIGLHLSLVLEDFPPSPLVIALLFLPLLASLLYYRVRQT